MNETKDAVDLAACARQIYAWQQANNKSDAQMIREFPGLGSAKTYVRLRVGDTADYDIEAQLAAYRSVQAVIEAMAGEGGQEPLFDDLSPVVHLRRAALEAMRQEGNGRVVIFQGPPGIGKSVAVRLLVGRYGKQMAVVEVADVWRDSPSAFLGGLLRALGADPDGLPAGRVERLEDTIRMLGQTRRCILVEESHHCGPHTLNTIKTLVNQTPAAFVLICIPTLWSRLETQAYQEARQLSTNRLSERVKLDLTEKDVSRYLRHVWPTADEVVLNAATKNIRPAALSSGNLAFVRDVCRAAQTMLGGADPTDPKLFADAVAAAARKR